MSWGISGAPACAAGAGAPAGGFCAAAGAPGLGAAGAGAAGAGRGAAGAAGAAGRGAAGAGGCWADAVSTPKPVAESSAAATVETAILRALEIGADSLRWIIRNPLYIAKLRPQRDDVGIVRHRCLCVKCGGNVASPEAS